MLKPYPDSPFLSVDLEAGYMEIKGFYASANHEAAMRGERHILYDFMRWFCLEHDTPRSSPNERKRLGQHSLDLIMPRLWSKCSRYDLARVTIKIKVKIEAPLLYKESKDLFDKERLDNQEKP
jgi:hypothetical protein